VTLDKSIYYFGDECDPLVAGRYLCDAIGNRTTSLLGYTLAYDDRDNRIRPTRGQSLSLSQDFAASAAASNMSARACRAASTSTLAAVSS
jgi:outer membrane protein insertion porin family